MYIKIFIAMLLTINILFSGTFEEAMDFSKKGDYNKAIEIYMNLAKKGDAKSENKLAVMYDKGIGVKKNSTKALYWYKKAAKQGYKPAEYNLGFFYHIRKRYEKALYWYKKSGTTKGYLAVGAIYDYKKKYKQASYWYKKAVKRGNPEATSYLGNLYQHGLGLKRDYKKALSLYNMAIKKGFYSAYVNLGVMYALGQGVKKDKVKAYNYWRIVASKRSYLGSKQKAQRNLDILCKRSPWVCK